MSLTVEDLCASLSSSHVGQEAIDLAALQVQLAQTLFCQSISSSSVPTQSTDDYAQPCNTPTSRTPSSSFSWSPMVDVSRQTDTVSPRRNAEDIFRDEMDEDERMVEDLLMPKSPMSAMPQTPTHKAQQGSATYSSMDASPSLFTSTDPFYIAQLQAAQNYGLSHQSVFTQPAFPSTPSPFFLQRPNHAQPALSLDPHPLLVGTASTFDR
ncbi:hypothetical protein C8F01DRAFT_1078604 [Mycena amicta]|nr:hypothetical protein C8F01DRAFT_1078604 [Mycena amicta]